MRINLIIVRRLTEPGEHMADTRVQLRVEDWVCKHWLPQHFGQPFHRERLELSSGGVFDFDAVSADNTIAATISTSASTTSSGKTAVGKLVKLRSDMFFLLLANAERRLVVLTEPDMLQLCEKERSGGRVPKNIEFHLAELPPELAAQLAAARAVASREVQPRGLHSK
jgi:hypothetical protein